MLAMQETFCRWLLPPRPRLWVVGSIAQIRFQMFLASFFSIPKIALYWQFKNLFSVIYTISEAHVRGNVFGVHAKSRSWICVKKLEIAFLLNEAFADMYCDRILGSWSIYTQKGRFQNLNFWDRYLSKLALSKISSISLMKWDHRLCQCEVKHLVVLLHKMRLAASSLLPCDSFLITTTAEMSSLWELERVHISTYIIRKYK